MSEQITVRTNTVQEYPIVAGPSAEDKLKAFLKNYSGRAVYAIIDQNVLRLHERRILGLLESHFEDIHLIIVPAGEASKCLGEYDRIMDEVLSRFPERNTPIVAIGGGVTGDLAGFIAATALRGMPLIHVPTTLLAMVDSSIGGKTGINHAAGKNLIGSFYQPDGVFAIPDILNTLPEKEWVNGMSEIIKYGFISDPVMLEEIESVVSGPDPMQADQWQKLIQKSIRIKDHIVTEDVKEKGIRAFLNFGHTYAHVIEQCGDYGDYSHGEAVFAGMYGALYVSDKLGADIGLSNLNALRPFYDLDLSGINRDPEELTAMMKSDKKVKDGKIRLILLKEKGNPYIQLMEDEKLIRESWEFILNTF